MLISNKIHYFRNFAVQKANALGVLVLSGETTYETAIAVHPNPDLILRDLAAFQQMILLAHEVD